MGNGKMFRPLAHDRCECWRCMEVRDENQAVRRMMGWRQPDYTPSVDFEEESRIAS